MSKNNTDITASTKPQYPVVHHTPPFTEVIANFTARDYLRFSAITGLFISAGYLGGFKRVKKGPSMATWGVCGVVNGFMYAFVNSARRIEGLLSNDDEVARSKKE